jgi:hypothetical protein
MESELKRQTAQQDAVSNGSGRAKRLDPAQMPHRFAARGTGCGEAAEAVAFDVYIDPGQVIVKRRLAGLPLTLAQPMSAFLGVFAEVSPGDAPGSFKARIGLMHRDPALSIELASDEALEVLAADWRAWADALSLPLLLVEADGHITRLDDPVTPAGETGTIRGRWLPTRRRVAALTARRPRFLVRRKAGRAIGTAPVHRGEREIIART